MPPSSGRFGVAAARRSEGGAPLLAAAGVLWGGAGAAGRMLATAGSLSSLEVAAGRALLGGVALLVAGVVLGRSWVRGRRAWRHVATMGVLTVAYQTTYFAAVAAGSLSVATLVALGSAPVLVTAVHAVQRRRLRPASVGILVLALVGLVLLVGRPDAGANVAVVAGLALGAGVAFALITLVNAERVPGVDPITATGTAFVLAGCVLALTLALFPGPAIVWSAALVGWLGVLGLLCTAAPYALYFTGLLRASAPVAALFALLEPVTGTVIAIFAFGERLGFVGWLGAGLLLAAVVAASVWPEEAVSSA